PEPPLARAVAHGHRAQIARMRAAGVRRHHDRTHRERVAGLLDADVNVDALAGLVVIAPGGNSAVAGEGELVRARVGGRRTGRWAEYEIRRRTGNDRE